MSGRVILKNIKRNIMEATDPKDTSNEQAIPGTYEPEKDAANQEDFPETGAETLTGTETDSSDLETEPPDDGDGDLAKEKDA
jgi:hypothetical protein